MTEFALHSTEAGLETGSPSTLHVQAAASLQL